MKLLIKKNGGYSFIEMLVVITLIAILGTITSEAFILGLKAQGKSEILKEVKQNADYAGQVMDSMIRNAENVDESLCNANSESLTILNRDGLTTTFDCSNEKLSSVSGEFPVPTVSQALVSTRVKIEACNFRVICPTPPLAPKYVLYNFTISQAGGGDQAVEKQAFLEYQTTVSLRNYE
ncbi:MAG: hypothetical protein UV73_C0009G0048 [Candidatus Gottesmanbacteria bacterium GW2011_GWA2_43_14]|uniref:Prepilin-type N-terminal cleavage/methylation domain-containing protein n=1 Tax=Candidatus Gottesmanbacteria bacterium GW2011_GWA2_43_14 TaxID=1618443 RepID=A0A0G1DGL7_9BACT|nr:MAG: hypothetical protein UV73_C0009G0048 [Candidatus Gottesmanbacteria bacterium GW2011_GWA2_43_14]